MLLILLGFWPRFFCLVAFHGKPSGDAARLLDCSATVMRGGRCGARRASIRGNGLHASEGRTRLLVCSVIGHRSADTERAYARCAELCAWIVAVCEIARAVCGTAPLSNSSARRGVGVGVGVGVDCGLWTGVDVRDVGLVRGAARS